MASGASWREKMVGEEKIRVGTSHDRADIQSIRICFCLLCRGGSARGLLLASAELQETSAKPQDKSGPDTCRLLLGRFGRLDRLFSLGRGVTNIIGSSRGSGLPVSTRVDFFSCATQ